MCRTSGAVKSHHRNLSEHTASAALADSQPEMLRKQCGSKTGPVWERLDSILLAIDQQEVPEYDFYSKPGEECNREDVSLKFLFIWPSLSTLPLKDVSALKTEFPVMKSKNLDVIVGVTSQVTVN